MNRKEVIFIVLNEFADREGAYIATCLDFCDRIQDEFSGYSYGLYAVEKKETGEFIGYTGFHNITLDVDFAPVDVRGRRGSRNFFNPETAPDGCHYYFGL